MVDAMRTSEFIDDVVITVVTYDTTDHRIDEHSLWSLERLLFLWKSRVLTYERYNKIINYTDISVSQFTRVKNPKNK